MRLGKHLLIGMIALLLLSGSLSQSAFASRHKNKNALPKHHSNTHYKIGPYANMFGGSTKAPKKQHVKKHSHYNH